MAFACSAANRVYEEWGCFVPLATFVVDFVA